MKLPMVSSTKLSDNSLAASQILQSWIPILLSGNNPSDINPLGQDTASRCLELARTCSTLAAPIPWGMSQTNREYCEHAMHNALSWEDSALLSSIAGWNRRHWSSNIINSLSLISTAELDMEMLRTHAMEPGGWLRDTTETMVIGTPDLPRAGLGWLRQYGHAMVISETRYLWKHQQRWTSSSGAYSLSLRAAYQPDPVLIDLLIAGETEWARLQECEPEWDWLLREVINATEQSHRVLPHGHTSRSSMIVREIQERLDVNSITT